MKAQWSHENSAPTELCSHHHTRCSLRKPRNVVFVFSRKHLFFLPAFLWICCVYLCSVSVCVHRGGKPKYDKVEKQTSTSEPNRAAGRESDGKCSSSITPISLLHLDMPPQRSACYHLVVFPPSAFLFLPLPHFYPCCEPHCIHRWLFI